MLSPTFPARMGGVPKYNAKPAGFQNPGPGSINKHQTPETNANRKTERDLPAMQQANRDAN